MKISFFKIAIPFTVFFSVMVLGILTGFLTFGNGLGDLYYLISIIFILIINSYLLLTKKNGEQRSNFFKINYLVSVLIILIFFLLRLTYFRGSEYPWNGSLLYTN